jgi:hypothetical protein
MVLYAEVEHLQLWDSRGWEVVASSQQESVQVSHRVHDRAAIIRVRYTDTCVFPSGLHWSYLLLLLGHSPIRTTMTKHDSVTQPSLRTRLLRSKTSTAGRQCFWPSLGMFSHPISKSARHLRLEWMQFWEMGGREQFNIIVYLDSAMDHPRSITNIICGYWLPCNVETDPEQNILVLWERRIVVAEMSRQHLIVVRWGSADSSSWCPTHQMSKKHTGPRKWNIDCGNQPSQNLRFRSHWWWPNSPQTDTHTTF